ncbi:hypothetical protein AAE478_008690 [Parahypoxylon ruwenzoriense]
MTENPPALPTPSSEFLSYLARYPDTPTRELLEPYLSSELWLRKAFKRDDTSLDGLANLVSIYNGHEDAFKIRTIDYQTADKSKYILSLSNKQRGVNGELAIAPSLDEYKNNFDAFTHGVLASLDWSNVVAAGSSALHPLLSHRPDIKIPDENSVQDPLEAYYQVVAKSSDIDLFLYGLDDEASAIDRIFQIEEQVRRNQRLFSGGAISLRSENAITLISPRYPYRHVQIILRLYKSISEILTGFDIDGAYVAFDGKQVYSNPRGVTAIATRTNTVDISRRSPSYENRLLKYRRYNFEVYWHLLERSRIDVGKFFKDDNRRVLTGLARLISFEHAPGHGLPDAFYRYRQERKLKRIGEAGDPMMTAPSGYARHELPYGERFTAEKVRDFVEKHTQEPYLFGTIHQVLIEGTPSGQGNAKLGGPVRFLKDDPGRQMIGSFYPLSEKDWTKEAYNKETPNTPAPRKLLCVVEEHAA